MRCPFCHAEKESLKVIDSRSADAGKAIRRRRECVCGKRFTTYERFEESNRMAVIKKDGRRVPWDRDKILAGLERACFKRPVADRELLRIRDEVEEEVFRTHDREVASKFIGNLIMERLRKLDQVAYVRFASVYRQFETLGELVEEARAVIDAKRYDDDPGQGKLFSEPATDGDGQDAAGHGQEEPADTEPPPAKAKRSPKSA